jgi:hypothetical protein
MKKIGFILLLNLAYFVGPMLWVKNHQTVFQAVSRPDRMRNETHVDQVMRDVGVCRLWNIVHDLPDRAFDKAENIPDETFRRDMNRRCPELRDSFIGPMDAQYYEDRKRWKKQYGKFWKEGRKND